MAWPLRWPCCASLVTVREVTLWVTPGPILGESSAKPAMRKIETLMNKAITNCVDWRQDNTEVEYNETRNVSYVKLHGNHIATIGDGFIELYSCGYRTTTTKSRLNAILKEHGNEDGLYQKNYDWFVSTKDGVIPFTEGMILR